MYYDLIVIGAGPAGICAALRARELGLKVCLIDKGQIGGTCLNQGCIPTKTLIQSAKAYSLTKKSSHFGIDITTPPQVNFLKIQERKDKIIQQLRSGMQSVLKGIDFVNAPAQILSNEEVKTDGKILKTRFILVATGAKPQELPGLKFDGKKIISSDEILDLKEAPASLLIIGAGVIGCEFAGLFSALGTQVSLLEKMPQLLPGQDAEIAKKLEAIFKKKGIKVNTNTDAKDAQLENYDLVLLCIGRIPRTRELGLEKAGIKLERERVLVDEYLKTNVPNIYAAGDCTAKIMLAHYASYQGRLAAENICHPSAAQKINDLNIPNCIFTDPEIASVGLTEEEAKNNKRDIKIHKLDFMGSGMARILDETEGFVKIISDQKTQEVLGASIIGARSTELIGILTLAVSTRLFISQIRKAILPHPTLSESITEAIRQDS